MTIQPNETAVYQIKFFYNDSKEVNINMPLNKMTLFFEQMSKKEIFWSKSDSEGVDLGFWTNLDTVRFIQLIAVKGEELNDISLPHEGSPVKVCEEDALPS